MSWQGPDDIKPNVNSNLIPNRSPIYKGKALKKTYDDFYVTVWLQYTTKRKGRMKIQKTDWPDIKDSSIINKVQPLLQTGATVYNASYESLESGELVLLCVDNTDVLAVSGQLTDLFDGHESNGYKICECNHKNRLVLNEILPYTVPVCFGRDGASFGFGDRLGFANSAQLRVVERTSIRPVLAQQSLRELSLMGRTLADVIDTAAWAVFREGYKCGYACDGDHLKTLEEVRNAVHQGCSMITLDCSLVLGHADGSEELWRAAFQNQSEEQKCLDRNNYLDNRRVRELGLQFTEASVAIMHEVYDAAIELARSVYNDVIVTSGRPIDLEISLDETVEITTPEAHFYVANELERTGVFVTGMAPKFVGEFQKAIEYIGDVEELEITMSLHAKIAELFGYRLSLHSGSEKFLVLPIIAKVTGGYYHVKTAGTSWLEVVETISRLDPSLYRRLHTAALEGFEDARKYYVVHCDLNNIPPLESVTDKELLSYLKQNDSRQLLHITYGQILGIPELKKDILEFLKQNKAAYEAEAEELYIRHLRALGAYTE